ncbi:MAG: hypothetical protein HY925_10265, partial [Elusimicrobia bacterium]|nr:hypothetical protein [Elusimicrobiota bacterium]
VRAQNWLWAKRALGVEGTDADASAALRLVEFLSEGDGADGKAWLKALGDAPMDAARRARTRRALPGLARAWKLPAEDALSGLVRSALAKAAPLRKGAPRAEPMAFAAKAAGELPPVRAAGEPSGPAASPLASSEVTPIGVRAQPLASASVLEKLAQRSDLAGSGGAEDLAELQKALKDNAFARGESDRGAAGAVESGELRWAGLDALKKALLAPSNPSAAPESESKPPLAGTPQEKRIEQLVARVEGLQGDAQSALGTRDSAAQMLSSADLVRGSALRERRSARETQQFRKNFSQWAMVMELSYTLNLLTSAEAAARGMQARLAAKLSDIKGARTRSEQALRDAEAKKNGADKWRQDSRESVEKDLKNMGDFGKLAEVADRFVTKVRGFREGVGAAVDAIENRESDRCHWLAPGQKECSASAAAEYRRRLERLPFLNQPGPNDGSDVTKLSESELVKQDDEVKKYLVDIGEGESKLPGVPDEFLALTVLAVPGVPAYTVVNADAGAVLRVLAERKDFWRAKLDEIREKASAARALVSSGDAGSTVDALGVLVPKSLVVRRSRAVSDENAHREQARNFARLMDDENRKLGSPFAMLSGLNPDQFHDALPGYASALDAYQPPAGGDDLENVAKSLDKLQIARYLPVLADHVISWAEAEKTREAIDEVMSWVPEVPGKLTETEQGLQAVLDDVSADEAWVRSGMTLAEGPAILARKRELITRLKSMLAGLHDCLSRLLIPYARKQAAGGAPGTGPDGYEKLYKSRLDLIEKAHEALDRTVPWAIAGWGASAGDSAGAHANIAKQRSNFQTYRQRVADFKLEIQKRTDPNLTETEELFGEQAAFSLVVRVKQYREEQARRAAQMNANGAAINEIVRKLQADTGGRYGLGRWVLPVDLVAGSPASKATLDALGHSTKIQDLGNALKQAARDAQAAGGEGIGGVAGGGTSVPTGTQPDVTLPDNQRIALTALEGLKRLLPSSATGDGGSYAEGVARYLFCDAVIEGSNKNLLERIPKFNQFLATGDGILDRVFADLDADEAFVSAAGADGSPVYARKLALFGDVRVVADAGSKLFEEKKGWDEEGITNVAGALEYYDGTTEVYGNSLELLKSEEEAALEYKASIDKMAESWSNQRKEVAGWLKQLNDGHESAMARIAQNLSDLQVKTRAVLETNGNYRRLKRDLDAAQAELEGKLRDVETARSALLKALDGVRTDDLDARLAARIDELTLGGPAWLSASARGPQMLVIKKDAQNASLAGFLNTILSSVGGSDTSSRDIAALRGQLMSNPNALAQLLPNAQMLSLGDDPNGFYLVYQSNFSVPGGLETESSVTLGNVGHIGLGDTNISAIGYRFASPPSAGNAPFGDQGITIQAESLGGEHAVNYLDVTFHRFLQDLPTDLQPQSQANEARMMIFDDFALMAADNKLYLGVAGFGDTALHDAANKPRYGGVNVKGSYQFQELMSLTAEQSSLWASDPRSFMQKINLDFTKFDPTLNEDYIISAKGEQKEYHRTKLGTSFDVGKALKSQDTFRFDTYWTKVDGTDDIAQQALGATVLKGFSFDFDGTPAKLSVSGTQEIGQQYNTTAGRVSFELPNQGVVLSAQGKILGDASTYFLEARKRTGENTEIFASYGSPYVGLNHRLTVGTQTSFTLGQLWRSAFGGAAEDALGGKPLEGFRGKIDEFFTREAPEDTLLGELKLAWASDVGKRLIELEIGGIARELAELGKAGAFMDNTRMRGMIGFVSSPIGTGTADRAAGGGFQIGTQTDMSLSKTKKALIGQKTSALFAAGLKLQTRLLELTKDWQQAVSDVVQAQWELALAVWAHDAASDPVLEAETRARAVEAGGRLTQARLRYNMLTGRAPDAETLQAVNPADFDQLRVELDVEGPAPAALGVPQRLAADDAVAVVAQGAAERLRLRHRLRHEPLDLRVEALRLQGFGPRAGAVLEVGGLHLVEERGVLEHERLVLQLRRGIVDRDADGDAEAEHLVRQEILQLRADGDRQALDPRDPVERVEALLRERHDPGVDRAQELRDAVGLVEEVAELEPADVAD